MVKDQSGVSLVALVITIIVIIIIASISILGGNNAINNAHETKFKNDLKEVVEALDVYHERANIHGDASYNPSDLTWNGESERAENTAKMEDHINEDRIRYIFTDEIPKTLQGKMTIESGKVKVNKNYKTEYQWAVEKYNYMKY